MTNKTNKRIKVWDFDNTLNNPKTKLNVEKFNQNYNVLITAREQLGSDQEDFIKKNGLKFDEIYVTGHKFYKVDLLIKNNVPKDVEIHENNPLEIYHYMKKGYYNVTFYPPTSFFDIIINQRFKKLIKLKDAGAEVSRLWLKYGEQSSTAY